MTAHRTFEMSSVVMRTVAAIAILTILPIPFDSKDMLENVVLNSIPDHHRGRRYRRSISVRANL